ncbi:MAG: LamG-like jellyroll fold domain-containing protein [Bacteroidota bacterium]
MQTTTIHRLLQCLFFTLLSLSVSAQDYGMVFDGNDDYIEVQNATTTPRMTIEAWIKPNSFNTNTYGNIIARHFQGSNGYIFQCGANGRLAFRVGEGSTIVVVEKANALVTDRWQHVVGVIGGKLMQLYVDGELVATTTTNATIANPSSQLRIGDNANLTNSFDGEIGELRIWGVARPSSSIRDQRFLNLNGDESGLLAYFPMEDEDSSSTITDLTGNTTATKFGNVKRNTGAYLRQIGVPNDATIALNYFLPYEGCVDGINAPNGVRTSIYEGFNPDPLEGDMPIFSESYSAAGLASGDPLTGNFVVDATDNQSLPYSLLYFKDGETTVANMDCHDLETSGQTLPFLEPTNIQIDDNSARGIRLSFTNESTLAGTVEIYRNTQLIETTSDLSPGQQIEIEDFYIDNDTTGFQNGVTNTYRARFLPKAEFTAQGTGDFSVTAIGDMCAKGGYTTDGTIHTISAGGRDIQNQSDEFRFVHKQLTGDFDVQVKLTDVIETNFNVKAGLVVKPDLAANGIRLSMLGNLKRIVSQIRSTKNGTTSATANNNVPGIKYLRIQRIGDTFTHFYRSENGSWQQVQQYTIALPDQLFVGMAVSSVNDCVATTATFEEVNINGGSGTLDGSFSYILGQASTFPFAVTATDNLPDRVKIDWTNVGNNSEIAYINIQRQTPTIPTATLETLEATDTSFVDLAPIRGVASTYEVRLFNEEGTLLTAARDDGFAVANGVIKGRVVTEEGNFPIEGVTVTATALDSVIVPPSNGSAITNSLGEFMISDLVYGAMDSFVLEAVLQDHEFFNLDSVFLTINTPVVDDILILGRDTLLPSTTDMNGIEINTFTAQALSDQDAVQLDWQVNLTDANKRPLIIEISRGEDILSISEETTGTTFSGSFTDLTGAPNRRYDYKIRAYHQGNNNISVREQTIGLRFPAVASLPATVFTASTSTDGFVELDWSHTSSNHDGFQLFRNEALIAELPKTADFYEDFEGEPGANLTYKIVAFRQVDNLTIASEQARFSNTITFPALPSPINVQATIFTAAGQVEVEWSRPAVLDDTYNYNGFRLYRIENSERKLLTIVYKNGETDFSFLDTEGIQQETYTYEVTSFNSVGATDFFESDAAVSNSVSYPTLKTPTLFSNSSYVGVFPNLPYRTTISIAAIAYNNVENYDGFQLDRDTSSTNSPEWKAIDDLPTYYNQIVNFYDYPNPNETNNNSVKYRLRAYKTIDGVRYYSDPNLQNVTLTFDANQTNVPLNFTASKDVPDHIRLNWDYTDAVASEFEIFRDDALIATLPVGTRSYYDYDALNNGQFVDYQIRAKEDDGNTIKFSRKTGDNGRRNDPFSIFGQVRHPATGIGIPNVLIRYKAGSVQFVQAAITDASGFYYLDDIYPKVAGDVIEIKAIAPNNDLTFDEATVTLTQALSYRVDFTETNEPALTPQDAAIASLITIEGAPDPISLHSIISFQVDSDNYEGIEVTRGLDKVKDILKGEPLVYVDTASTPGVQQTYILRPYKTENGNRIYSETEFYRYVTPFPSVAPVVGLTAEVLTTQDVVAVKWSHPFATHTSYKVFRSEEEIGTIAVGERTEFVDETGIPGQTYIYKVVAIQTNGSSNFVSEPREATATYPEVATIFNLEFQPDPFLNGIVITAETNSDLTTAFDLFRNDVFVRRVPRSQGQAFSFLDVLGTPDGQDTYSIVALLEKDGIQYASEPISATTTFPILFTPASFQTTEQTTTIQLDFSYPFYADGLDYGDGIVPADIIDGFYIYRKTASGNFNNSDRIATLPNDATEGDFGGLTPFMFDDKTGVPNTNYRYGVQAFTLRNGVTYVSPIATITSEAADVLYPPVADPQNVQASKGDFFNKVEVSWSFVANAIIDSVEVAILEFGTTNVRSTIVLPGISRTFTHSIPEPNSPDNLNTYRITALRYNNGNIYRSLSEDDFGFTSGQNVPTKNTFDGGSLSNLGYSVAVDDDWMVVGDPFKRIVAVYRLNCSDPSTSPWQLFQTLEGLGPNKDFPDRLGTSVAIYKESNTEITIASGSSIDNVVLIWKWNTTVQRFVLDGELAVTKLVNFSGPNADTRVDTDNPASYCKKVGELGISLSLYENKLIVGAAHGTGLGTSCGYGGAYRIYEDNNDTWSITHEEELDNLSSFRDRFGHSVDWYGDFFVVSATKRGIPNKGGVYVYKYDDSNNSAAMQFSISTRDNSPSNLNVDNNARYGWKVSLSSDHLAVLAPLNSNKAFLYKLNTSSNPITFSGAPIQFLSGNGGAQGFYSDNIFDLDLGERYLSLSIPDQDQYILLEKQSNGTWNEIVDRATIVSSIRQEGRATAVNDHFAFFGTPDNLLPWASFNDYIPTTVGGSYNGQFTTILPQGFPTISVTAEDQQTDDQINISWDTNPFSAADRLNIYRDGALIASNVNAQDGTYTDDIINGAVAGQDHFYEIQATTAENGQCILPQGDNGSILPNGTIKGKVIVDGSALGNSQGEVGVSNVTLQLTGTLADGGVVLMSTTSELDGSFVFENLPYDVNGTTYEITPSLMGHRFDSTFYQAVLSASTIRSDDVTILDTSAYFVQGQVKIANSDCGLEDLVVELQFKENEGDANLGNVVQGITNAQGRYAIPYDPYSSIDANGVAVYLNDVQTIDPNSTQNQDAARQLYDFTALQDTFIVTRGNGNLNIISEVNFEDQLTYTIPLSVKTACGDAIPGNNRFMLEIVSLDDNCYRREVTTNTNGEVMVNVPAIDFGVRIVGVDGTAMGDANAAIEYFNLRPARYLLGQLHQAADGELLTDLDPILMTFHNRATISFNEAVFPSSCSELGAPVIEEGDRFIVRFAAKELFGTQDCDVQEGYLVILNAASGTLDTVQLADNGQRFLPYAFTANNINPIAPYRLGINVRYFDNSDYLQGERTIPIIVIGSSVLPGSALIIEPSADEAGQIKLPLFVLRDPPGDRSYSQISSGTKFSTSLTRAKNRDRNGGFTTRTKLAFLGAGFYADGDVGGGATRKNANTVSFSTTVNSTIRTSNSNGDVGREADIIVGLGAGVRYGLTQQLDYDPATCEITSFTSLGFAPGKVETTFNFSIRAIERRIKNYRRDSLLIRQGIPLYTDEDGSPLDEEESLAKVSALIQGWEDMIRYHDLETLPYYSLCTNSQDQENIRAEAQVEIDKWRNAFCDCIGNGIDETFVLDNDINWESNNLIEKYNTTIAAVELLKYFVQIKDKTLDDELTTLGVTLDELEFSESKLNSSPDFKTAYENAFGASIEARSLEDGSEAVSIKTTQTSTSSVSNTTYSLFSLATGIYTNVDASAGSFITSSVNKGESKIGFFSKRKVSWQTSKKESLTNTTDIKYVLADNDNGDEVNVLVIKGASQNHTPLFWNLGGKSSCPPEEALIPGQDQDPIQRDNFTIGGMANNAFFPGIVPPQYDINGNSASFTIQVSNNNADEDRDIVISLDVTTNTYSATIEANGSNLNNGPLRDLTVPKSGSILVNVIITRNPTQSFYNLDDIKLVIEADCSGGGDKEALFLTARFRSPCTTVSVTSPENGFVVRREDENTAAQEEQVLIRLRDYDSDNVNLERIELEYRRQGTTTFQPITSISKATLQANDANLALILTPFYDYVWDITGQYSALPDGEYEIRARAICSGAEGITSNVIRGELRRSALDIVGSPEPADGLFTLGDEISATYAQDVDCALLQANLDNLELFDLTDNQVTTNYDVICQYGKVQFILQQPELYDNHLLRATYRDVQTLAGNVAEDVIWTFRVVTSPVDWFSTEQLVVNLFEDEIETKAVSLLNTTLPNVSVSGLSITAVNTNGTTATNWVTFDVNSPFSLPVGGQLIGLTFDGSVGMGSYNAQVEVSGATLSRTAILPVRLNVFRRPPPNLVPTGLTESMTIRANWKLDAANTQLSTDTLDQIHIYINDEMRAYSSIQNLEGNFFADLNIVGELADVGEALEFAVWDASAGQYFEAMYEFGSIVFEQNAIYGTTVAPTVLLTDGTIRDIPVGNCEPTLTLNSPINTNNTFQAAQTITSTATIGNTNPNISVTYLAGNSITLRPGFHAQAGVTFSAIIDVCEESIETNEEVEERTETELKQISSALKTQPNPFQSSLDIAYFLAESGEVEVTIIDQMGRAVQRIVQTQQGAGWHYLTYDATDLVSGLYFVQLRTEKEMVTNRLVKVE